MPVRLHGADLVQRFVEKRADVADAILARARELAHAAAEQDDRHDHERHAGQHEQRQLRRSSASSITRPPTISRKLRIAIDALEPITVSSIVVSLMSREITSPVRVASKNARRQVEQVVEHRAAQVGRDALAEPRHVVEAHVRRSRHHDDDAEHQRQHPVELAGVRRGESAIDDELQSLADGQHRAGGDDEPIAANTTSRRYGRRKRPTRATVCNAVTGGILGAGSRRVSARAIGMRSECVQLDGRRLPDVGYAARFHKAGIHALYNSVFSNTTGFTMNAPLAASLFGAVDLAPRDPILGVTEAFNADANPRKVNLGVGVYVDDNGKVPLLDCVKRAEREMTDKASPRTYLPIDGIPAYDKAVQ